MQQEQVDTTEVECLVSSSNLKMDIFLHARLILLMRYSPLRMRAMPAYHNHYEMSKM